MQISRYRELYIYGNSLKGDAVGGKVDCKIQAVELELAVTLFMLSFLFQTHSKNRTNPRDKNGIALDLVLEKL